MTRVSKTEDLGKALLARRRELGYSQSELAGFCGCGTRFISDLENGKESIQLGKALDVASMMGLNVYVERRGDASD